jgi:ATP-dependent Clp protease ATP-binding subunit ClpA
MTSNVGARDMTRRAIGFGGEPAGDGKADVERLFSPEFRNRLDAVVTFQKLTSEVMGRVVDKFIGELGEKLREKKVEIELGGAARGWLAERGYDPLFGARPLARVIRTELEDKLSDALLFGPLAKGGKVFVDAHGDALAFRFESRAPARPAGADAGEESDAEDAQGPTQD